MDEGRDPRNWVLERRAWLWTLPWWTWTLACLLWVYRGTSWNGIFLRLVQPFQEIFPSHAIAAFSSWLVGAFSVLALLASVWVVGEALCRRVAPGPWHGRLALSYGLGLAFYSLLLTALGFAGFLGEAALRRLMVLLTGSACLFLSPALKRLKAPVLRPFWLNWEAPEKAAALCAALFIAAMALPASLFVTTFYDAWVYHLAVPEQYLKAGSFIPLRFNLYSAFPMGWDILHAMGLAWGSCLLAKSLSLGALLGFGVLCVEAAGPLGLTGALFFAGAPAAVYLLWGGGVELGQAFFAVLAWHCFLKSGEEAKHERFWLGAVCAASGMLLASKYTSALIWSVSGLLMISRRRSPAFAAAYGLSGALFLGPWLLKNWLHWGNPFYPFGEGALSKVVGEYSSAIAPSEWLRPETWLNVVSPFKPFNAGTTFLDFYGVAGLWLLPVLWRRRADGKLRLVLAAAAVVWAGWAFSTRMGRYLAPAIALLYYAGARAFALERPSRAARWGGLALALAPMLVSGAILSRGGAWRVFLGLQRQAEYYARKHPSWFNPYTPLLSEAGRLPWDAKILLLGEARGLYLPRRAEMGSALEEQPISLWAREAGSPETLRERLRQEGVTHLLLNLPEALRLQSSRPIFLWDEPGRAAFAGFWDRYVDFVTSRVRVDREYEFGVFLYALRDSPRPAGESPPENLVLGLEEHLRRKARSRER